MPSLDPVSALMRVLSERWVTSLALPASAAANADAGAQPPHVAPLFYALAPPDTLGVHPAPLLIFTSDPDSHHGQLAGLGPVAAAASVYLEAEGVDELRGAQLRGTLLREERCDDATRAALRVRYLARHPIAAPLVAAGRHRFYALLLTWGKVTDNRLGFGVHPQATFADTWSGRLS